MRRVSIQVIHYLTTYRKAVRVSFNRIMLLHGTTSSRFCDNSFRGTIVTSVIYLQLRHVIVPLRGVLYQITTTFHTQGDQLNNTRRHHRLTLTRPGLRSPLPRLFGRTRTSDVTWLLWSNWNGLRQYMI